MKKLLIFIVLLSIILCSLFYKDLRATVDFYSYQQQNPELFQKATINWKQIPFTSTGSQNIADQSLSFASLQFPLPFTATVAKGDDTSIALGNGKSIKIERGGATADFFTVQSIGTEEKQNICAFLSQTSGRGACTSSYNFARAFLELNQTDIHAFTTTKNKTLYNQLLTLRANIIPINTISAFETSRIQGFLFIIDSQNYVANIFDQNDTPYQITFTNVSRSEIGLILSSITLKQ